MLLSLNRRRRIIRELYHLHPVHKRWCTTSNSSSTDEKKKNMEDLEAKWAEEFQGWREMWKKTLAEDSDQELYEREKQTKREEKPRPVIKRGTIGSMSQHLGYGTGRRKTSVARVWLRPGDGRVMVNSKSPLKYFLQPELVYHAFQPLQLTTGNKILNIHCSVKGGGLSGQAGAIRLAVSRALLQYSPAYRSQLRDEGMLTRDSRMVERKKPGQAKARKKFQWVKR